MGFQTKQPYRLKADGRIVASVDPRDFETLRQWFFAQGWIGLLLGFLFSCAVWTVTLGGLAALYMGAGRLRDYLTGLLLGG